MSFSGGRLNPKDCDKGIRAAQRSGVRPPPLLSRAPDERCNLIDFAHALKCEAVEHEEASWTSIR